MSEPFKIQTFHAFVVVGEDGDEGVIGVQLGDVMYPLVAADETRLKELRPYAEQVVQEHGLRVELIKLSHREHVEWLEQCAETQESPHDTL